MQYLFGISKSKRKIIVPFSQLADYFVGVPFPEEEVQFLGDVKPSFLPFPE